MTTANDITGRSPEVARLVARIADTKYVLGKQYAEWCAGAPTLESAVAAAAMAQDELGHARALYPLLRTLDPTAGAENDPETRSRFASIAALDQPFADWADFVAANYLVDGAMTLLFEAAIDSSYEPLAGRSRKALQEESTHAMHAEAWVRRMATTEGGVRAALESTLQRVWWDVLCWFGPAGEGDQLAAAHVLDATPDQLRARFLARVGPLITSLGLRLPVAPSASGSYEPTEALPWKRWDGATYRLRPPAKASAKAAATGKVPSPESSKA
jgi:ring-1,2-phenylacetyl-CoA epoxidase subunit PaaC